MTRRRKILVVGSTVFLVVWAIAFAGKLPMRDLSNATADSTSIELGDSLLYVQGDLYALVILAEVKDVINANIETRCDCWGIVRGIDSLWLEYGGKQMDSVQGE